MKKKSIWLENIVMSNSMKLNRDIEVDVLIIGGGMTGLSCAYYLQNQGLELALVEQNRIGHGVSARTTGKITYFQDVLLDIEKYRDINETKLYVESQKEAINLIKDTILQHQIECDFSKNNSFLLTKTNQELFLKHQQLWKQLGIDVKYSQPNIAYVQDAYSFHPVKFIYGLKTLINVPIYEQTKVIKIEKDREGYRCYTENHQIYANKVIIASHYPFFTIPFYMPLKCYVEKAVLFASRKKQQDYHALSLDRPLISWRFYKDYQITLSPTPPHKHKEVVYMWTNNDVITYDRIPFIGSVDKNDSLFVATGYNTWGMTNGFLAGKIISDTLLGQQNKYIALFNPKRPMNLAHVSPIMNIVSRNIKGFLLKKNKSNSVFYEKRNGMKVAVYVDEMKKEHVVKSTCPHLGCRIVFNNVEKTWDCPCHGSRFDLEGHVIEGPSQYDISIKK